MLHNAFRFISLSVVLGLTLPVLFRDGMFMDAMLYTSVAHNQAHGIGSFWFPVFSDHGVAGWTTFHEQPPLVFWIQSLFFRVLGDSMYTERIYTFIVILFSVFLFSRYWRWMYRADEQSKKLDWLPPVFWMIIPVCFWSYSQNQHENTMTLFIIAAVAVLHRGMEERKAEYWMLAGAVLVFLATMCKGLPGLFPMGVPFFHWLIFRRHSFISMAALSLLSVLALLSIYAILIGFSEEARVSLRIYFFERALSRIASLPTVDSHFYIVGRLFTELIVPVALAGLLYVLLRRYKTVSGAVNNKLTLFFFLIGFSGSLPLMLTLVQKGFYFVPGLPFFAIGLSCWIAQPLSAALGSLALKKKVVRLLSFGSLLLFFSLPVITATQLGKYSRDQEMLEDVYQAGPLLAKEKVVSMPAALWNEWSLQCYLMRYYFVSSTSGVSGKYHIRLREDASPAPVGYAETGLDLKRYRLYERAEP